MGADSSNEPKPGSPRFFKVVRNPSAPHLILPIAFVREYFDKIPKNPKLKTATGEHSWRLQIKKIGEDYCFVDGWERLAKDAELCIRDIIVFWLIDTFTFQVLFFDEHGCEKDLPLKEIGDGDGDDDDDDDGGGVSVTRDEDLYFQKVISWKTISINWYKWDKNEKHLKPGTGLLQLREGLKVFANLICSTTVSRCFKVLI